MIDVRTKTAFSETVETALLFAKNNIFTNLGLIIYIQSEVCLP